MAEPVKLADVLPEVFKDIERRCNRYEQEHRQGVFGATADFLRSKRPNRNRHRQPSTQKVLF